MPEDVASVAFADRNKVFGRTPEHALQIGPFGRKFRQHNPTVPGIVRNQRKSIEVGIVSASIVHEFDGSAYAVMPWLRLFASLLQVICPSRLGKNSDYGAGVA